MKTFSMILLASLLCAIGLVACIAEHERPEPAGYHLDGGGWGSERDVYAPSDAGDADADADATD